MLNDKKAAICGLGPRGDRIHYYHEPGRIIFFFDPSDGSVRKKMFTSEVSLPKFTRSYWTDPGQLFIFGGRVGDAVTNVTFEYNGSTKSFEERADMCEPRSDSTPVYVPHLDRIYVLGGNDISKFYKECEYYEPAIDRWTPIAPMSEARDSGAAALFNKQWIYAFSGRNVFTPKRVLDIVERYNISENTWETINVISFGPWIKNDLALAWQHNSNSICVFGGIANGERTEKCYLFNTETNSWKKSTPMPDVGSMSVVAEIANNKIYFVGWTNQGKKLFVWDQIHNTWSADTRFVVV